MVDHSTTSPFAAVASNLFERGLSVVPLVPREQRPGNYVWGKWENMKKWSYLCQELPTNADIEKWSSWPDANIGFPLGPASGIVALDFDTDETQRISDIEQLVGMSPVKKLGSKGFTAFYRYNPNVPKGRKLTKPGEKIYTVELLNNGNQTVIPPSIHPRTNKPYTYITPETLESIDVGDLPLFPDDGIEKIEAYLGIEKPKPITANGAQPRNIKTPPLVEVGKALAFVGAYDYDTWLKIGMGLRHEFGDAAFSVWDDWSSKDIAGYSENKAGELETKWRSFNSAGVTIATIFGMACDGGYIYPKEATGEAPSLEEMMGDALIDKLLGNAPVEPPKVKEVAPWMNLPENKEKAPDEPENESTGNKSYGIYAQKPEFPQHLVDTAPNLVGDLATWILSTGIKPQPVLSLSASIAFAGVVMGHRIKSPTDLRTNMYCLSVAPSASGKDHPRKCLVALSEAAGIPDILGGKPKSGTGLLTTLEENQGRRLVQIDEMGKFLQNLTSKNASSHQNEIMSNMMEIFSSASSRFIGDQYGNRDGKNRRNDIMQPNLCLHASTVPNRYYQAITSADAIDGFIPRMMTFESQVILPKMQKGGDLNNPPEELIKQIVWWENQTTNVDPGGDLDAAMRISPRECHFTPKAESYLGSFTEYCDEKMERHFALGDGIEAIWGRAREHAIKLALCASKDFVVDDIVMRWSIEVLTFITNNTVMSLEDQVSDNEIERSTKRMLSTIRARNGISMRELTRKTQWMSKKQRMEFIETLSDSEQIYTREAENGAKKIYAKRRDE